MTPEIAFKEVKRNWQDKKFVAHTCSICEYVCGYIWIYGKLHYDAGCDCLDTKIVEKRNESELLEFIKNNPEITAANFGIDLSRAINVLSKAQKSKGLTS